MKTIWRKIPDFPNYSVSNTGKVKNKRGKILSGGSSDGRPFVVLSKNTYMKGFQISRLVAGIFIPNPLGLRYVKNIDGDITNNKVTNLLWATDRGDARSAYKLTETQVVDILTNITSNETMAIKYKVDASLIRQIRNREIWTHVKIPPRTPISKNLDRLTMIRKAAKLLQSTEC